MHQDSDGDSPNTFFDLFHPHHVPDLFTMHGIIRAEIESHNHVHADGVMLG